MAMFGGGIWGLLVLISVVWVIYDIFTNQKRMSDLHKVVWIIAALIFNIFAVIVYYFVVKK